MRGLRSAVVVVMGLMSGLVLVDDAQAGRKRKYLPEDITLGEPRVDLRVTLNGARTRMMMTPTRADVLIRVFGIESDDYYCLGMYVDWGSGLPEELVGGSGNGSGHSEDCVPFEERHVRGFGYERYYRARHWYRAGGEYRLTVTLTRGGYTTAKLSETFVLIGR